MHRVEFHIVRTYRHWEIQNTQAEKLQTFREFTEALDAVGNRAIGLQRRGLNVRVTLHHPGKAAEVFEFPAVTSAQSEPAESYALTRCLLA